MALKSDAIIFGDPLHLVGISDHWCLGCCGQSSSAALHYCYYFEFESRQAYG